MTEQKTRVPLAYVGWQPSKPLSTAWSILDREGGNEVTRIPHSVIYGEVDVSGWDLHPLHTPIHDPVLDGPTPPRG